MASGRACPPRQEERLSAKGGPREGLGFLFKPIILPEKLNFELIFSSPNTSEDNFFAVYCAPNKVSTNRIGVSVAKRIINKATKRNRLKRLVKKSFLSHFKNKSGTDVVIRVKQQASTTADDKILLNSLSTHWQKVMKHSETGSTTSG